MYKKIIITIKKNNKKKTINKIISHQQKIGGDFLTYIFIYKKKN